MPSPKIKKTSDKSGLETIVDLAVGRFDLANGSVTVAERKMPLDAHGENLRALLAYNTLRPGYQGEISMAPLHLRSGGNAPVDVDIKLPMVLERDSIRLQQRAHRHAGIAIDAFRDGGQYARSARAGARSRARSAR